MTRLGPSLRRAKLRERPGRRVAVALALSLLANAAGVALLVRAGAFRLTSRPEQARVALRSLSAAEWAANRASATGKEPEAPEPFAMPRPPPKAPPEEEWPDGQVVDVARPKDRTRPKDARFLAEHDGSVERETRSRHARAGYERTLPVPSAPGAESPPPPGEDGDSERSVPGLEGAPGAPEPEREAVVALAPTGEGGLAVAPRAGDGTRMAAPAPGAGDGGERRAADASQRRLIAPGTLARVAGGPAPDHLEDVEVGEGTFLNTRAWKYATYFNRIKQAVAVAWDPHAALDARDPDRTMFGYKDRFTLLGVTLDDSGHLKNVVVEETSGVEFLDRAAMTAFERAQPFMNPPPGIVDGNGEIRFVFGFTLEFGRPGLRIYRAPVPNLP